MKKQITKNLVIIILLLLQILQILGNFSNVEANIKEGDVVKLLTDHECHSLVEYWMTSENRWSYKIVYYVFYVDKDDGMRYPAFCIEPAKNGVGTGYDSYNVTIRNETDNRIWRILNKGYMGSTYVDWNLECDDDFYTANKIALHSLVEGVSPKEKYIVGNRSVDGNSVEEISRRGEKSLNVAQTLYEYGINGTETYIAPQVNATKQGKSRIETIQNISYYVQNYQVTANKTLKDYQVEIQNFPNGTKIFNLNNQEQRNLSSNLFKIAIPVNQIKHDINGTIQIKDAQIKTNPIFYCNSSIPQAQSYITYMSGYEKANTFTTMQVKANTSNLEIQKIDAITKKPIANVTFEVKDEKGNKLGEVTTNQNGIATLSNLVPQTVSVKEIKVPEPYELSTTQKQVRLEYGKKASVIFENERKKGNLKIVKVDAENKSIPLENVEFALYNAKNELVEKLITNKKGEAYIENLEIGTYTLKETKTNEGYDLAQDKKIEIKWNQTIVEQVENKKQKGQIEIYKVDAEDKKLKIEGVVFEVLDENKNRIETILTNKEGYAITSRLPIGNYYIKEIKSGNNYILKQDLIKVEVKKEQITTCEVENTKKKGKIEVYKVDKEDNKIKLENVEFEVRNSKNELVDIIITNKEGYGITKELPIGEYTIKEIKTNENYVLDDNKIKIEVKYGEVETLKLENERIKGKIKIVKISENDNLINKRPKGSPIQGVIFELIGKNGELIENLITNEEGIAISKELEKGTYTIKEIKNHPDYEITSKEFKIEIKEHGEIEEITITNISKEPKLPRTGF